MIVSTTQQFMKKTIRYSFTILGVDLDGIIQEMELSSDNEILIRSWQAIVSSIFYSIYLFIYIFIIILIFK